MARISIIEDDQLISQMYRMKLESSGYEVSVADNGMNGIKMVKEEVPDLILLDLTLPDLGGEAVLDKLREIKTAMATPIVVLTNIDDVSAPKRLAKWDISDYIIKANLLPSEVVERIQEILTVREKLTNN